MRNWIFHAISDAKSRTPEEACGFVALVRGREQYISCRNAASNPAEDFEISAEDFAAASAQGEIIAVVHSHPAAPAEPSAKDLLAHAASGLTWHIIGHPETRPQLHSLYPDVPPLSGRNFIHGEQDCYTAVRDWFATQRGIYLPEYPREQDWWLKGQNIYLEHFAEAGFVEVSTLQDADAVLMRIGSSVPNHAAVVLPDGKIFHHLAGRLSCTEPYSGFYRKLTTHYLRYKPCEL